MKIGIKRTIDSLGRLCVPKDMRDLFGMKNDVEIVVTEEGILIRNPQYILVKKEEFEQEVQTQP